MPCLSTEKRWSALWREGRQWLAATGFVLALFAFWGWELNHALGDITERTEERLVAHQQALLDGKAEDIRDVFQSIYQSVRTISLLPMVREAPGGNRPSTAHNVVRDGRFSPDADRTLQQIYSNLQANVQVSEVYYVIDGFRPEAGEVPFFMYDEHISGGGRLGDEEERAHSDALAEIEDVEYAYYLKQLEWFRRHEPTYRFASRIEEIPAIISPLMRTCDNTQYVSIAQGNERDAYGLLYSVPVYDLAQGQFRGIVSAVLRANVLEARLVGVPFLILTERDQALAAQLGFSMPESASQFVLEERTHGIRITDRRNGELDAAGGANTAAGRWAVRTVDLATGGEWTLRHYLQPAEIETLAAPLVAEWRIALASRVALAALLVALIAAVYLAQRRRQKDLLWLAQHDPLTQLPNRRVFFARLGDAITRSSQRGERVGLFFIDVNDFNAVNDTLGHHGGDQMLVEIARRLRERVRLTDEVIRLPVDPRFLVSRLGGDEFGVIVEGVATAHDVPLIADRLVAGLREPIVIGEQLVEISTSIGVAVFPDDARDAEELLLSADTAMHQCRRQGDGYHLFNEALRKRAEREHLLSVELHSALGNNEFELVYQPKVALATASVISFEALLRWRSARFGMVSPMEFIPLLERSGQIIAVGAWVMRQACQDLHTLQAHGWDAGHISVNVSVRQLRDLRFQEEVTRILTETATPPEALIIEVTESIAMDDVVEGVDMLRRLRALGVKLAIDDFGTGYSSLTYLSQLPADFLKLDKAFISSMHESDKAMHVVASVIALAKGLSLRTIAEGVEDPAQAAELRRLGCEMIQGYLMARPMPLAEAESWLVDNLQGVSGAGGAPLAA